MKSDSNLSTPPSSFRDKRNVGHGQMVTGQKQKPDRHRTTGNSIDLEIVEPQRDESCRVDSTQVPKWSVLFEKLDPQSLLPPLVPWEGASESLIVDSSHPWATPAEIKGFAETPDYAESIRWLESLCAESDLLTIRTLGHSAQGRPIICVVASTDVRHVPASLGADGKPNLLIQAGVHPGEIEGKDAGFMMLRDIVTGRAASLLEGVNLLFIPVLNPDGHERSSPWNRPNQRGPKNQGWRTTAQNLNLNRDYVKADASEMNALLVLLRDWRIDFFVDIHSTDGIDCQYDITYAYHGRLGTPSWSPAINRWLDDSFSPAIDSALREQGHVPLNLYVSALNNRDLVQGLREWQMSPRYSLGFGDIRHIPTVLVETHSLKPYRQRVLGTYVFIASTMSHLAAEARALKTAIKTDCGSRLQEVPLTWAGGGPRRELDFLGIDYELYHSPASGIPEVRWLGKLRTYAKLPVFTDRVGLVAQRPVAYWVEPIKVEVIDLLRRQGIWFETIDEEITIEVEICHIKRHKKAQEFKTEESRHPVEVNEVARQQLRRSFPAGSVRVPTDQVLGELAVLMLEPIGSDSLLRWGFFPEIFQRTEYIEGYVIAPLAERMMGESPELRREFEEKVAADPVFAQSPDARLHWFYERSPFYDQDFLRYPVAIER